MRKSQVLKIKTKFIGLHSWPEAPEEVFFLRAPHRHVFHVEVQIPTVDDRELEFFMVQTRLNQFLAEKYPYNGNYGRKSCEVMAEDIGYFLMKLYNLQVISVEVNEDGENGSVVTLERD